LARPAVAGRREILVSARNPHRHGPGRNSVAARRCHFVVVFDGRLALGSRAADLAFTLVRRLRKARPRRPAFSRRGAERQLAFGSVEPWARSGRREPDVVTASRLIESIAPAVARAVSFCPSKMSPC